MDKEASHEESKRKKHAEMRSRDVLLKLNPAFNEFREGNNTLTSSELNKDLYEIKEDLLNNTLKSKEKYHDWVNKHKVNIFPKEFTLNSCKKD